MKLTFDEFQNQCRQTSSLRRECDGWRLAFDEKDFQREWYVTAFAGNHAACVMAPSASMTHTTPPEIVSQLVAMIEDLRSGQ